MAPYDNTTSATRFDTFHVYRTPFKTIGTQNIDTGILIPKDLKPGPHPVIVKYHGGGLVLGDALYADWVAAWLIPFIHRNNAIAVLPNYRLTPEHTGNEILEDLADFWTWFKSGGVEEFVKSENVLVELDYNHVIAVGDSAGGYMAIQMGLTLPKGDIKAVVAQYPMTNFMRRTPESPMIDEKAPPQPSLIKEHMAAVQPGSVISSAIPPNRHDIFWTLNAYGLFNDYFGTGAHLWPITAVESAKYLPPIYIVHGEQDTIVEAQDSKDFVKKARESLPDAELRLDIRDDNRDHGFDDTLKEDEEPWLQESLKWVEQRWLA